MRNIFDQYRHPENRLTHALVSSLAADPLLLRNFVRWTTGEHIANRIGFEILEQRLPGEEEPIDENIDENEDERRGLPDAWIHDGGKWALVIESKIESSLKLDQLERHRQTAEKRGFIDVHLLALVTKHLRIAPSDVTIKTWTDLYSWLLKERQSEWTRRLTSYMEVLERKLVADKYLKEGTLTMFVGIPFGKDCPYNYLEAKRLLRLATVRLRNRGDLKRELRMDPDGEGRPAITGSEGSSVWDFLPLDRARGATAFTTFPHLTISIRRDHLRVGVTIPNGIQGDFRRRLLTSKESFIDTLEQVAKNLKKALGNLDGVSPRLELVQRHFPSQRSHPIDDAKLEFDLRTAFAMSGSKNKAVKSQPQWLCAAYDALKHKRSNLQLVVEANFSYERCPVVNSQEILDYIAQAWIACKPLISATVG